MKMDGKTPAALSGPLSRYCPIKVVGQGSYGEVTLHRFLGDKKKYVLKKMDVKGATGKEQDMALQEAKLMATLKHPNVVAYKESFTAQGFLYISMGYCEGGDLSTRLKRQRGTLLPEDQVVDWTIQIAFGLEYLHNNNILHRDLKTQNIFLTRSKMIKLGDLGIAKVLDDCEDMASTVIGTPYYMSPELYSNVPYNHKSDVWAFGCCVYEISTLRQAFNARDLNALAYKVIRGNVARIPSRYSNDLSDLVMAMLTLEADERPAVSDIIKLKWARSHIERMLRDSQERGGRKQQRCSSGVSAGPRRAVSAPGPVAATAAAPLPTVSPRRPPHRSQSEGIEGTPPGGGSTDLLHAGRGPRPAARPVASPRSPRRATRPGKEPDPALAVVVSPALNPPGSSQFTPVAAARRSNSATPSSVGSTGSARRLWREKRPSLPSSNGKIRRPSTPLLAPGLLSPALASPAGQEQRRRVSPGSRLTGVASALPPSLAAGAGRSSKTVSIVELDLSSDDSDAGSDSDAGNDSDAGSEADGCGGEGAISDEDTGTEGTGGSSGDDDYGQFVGTLRLSLSHPDATPPLPSSAGASPPQSGPFVHGRGARNNGGGVGRLMEISEDSPLSPTKLQSPASPEGAGIGAGADAGTTPSPRIKGTSQVTPARPTDAVTGLRTPLERHIDRLNRQLERELTGEQLRSAKAILAERDTDISAGLSQDVIEQLEVALGADPALYGNTVALLREAVHCPKLLRRMSGIGRAVAF